MHETNHIVDDVKPGDDVTVKGEIIHGAYYDAGLSSLLRLAK